METVYILSSIEIIFLVTLSIIGFKKMHTLTGIDLHILKNYNTEENRELNLDIPAWRFSESILSYRIKKRPDKLPHNTYLDKKYKEYRILSWAYIINYALIGINLLIISIYYQLNPSSFFL